MVMASLGNDHKFVLGRLLGKLVLNCRPQKNYVSEPE